MPLAGRTLRLYFGSLQKLTHCNVYSPTNPLRPRFSLVPHGFRNLLHTTRVLQDVIPFKLSDIGEGIREVVVKEWFVEVGDNVRQFDPVCEVQSDKATVTITSRYDGIVRALHFKPQDTCLVGQALVDIEVDNSSSNSDKRELHSVPVEVPDCIEPEANRIKVLATPSVRRLAAEYKISLSDVVGTGKAGRVLKEDVLNLLNKGQPTAHETTIVASTPTSPSRPQVASTEEDEIVPLTTVQRAMKTTMTLSNQIPHFVLSAELDVAELVELRSRTAKAFMEQHGLKLTYMPFFVKATSLALLQFPMLNAHTSENCEHMVYKAAHNIGIAIDTPEGLLVPSIKSVERLSVIQIATELKRLQDLGARGKLGTDDLSGTTVTLSNIGSLGGTYTSPRILPPQVLIGGIGRIQRLPRFGDDGTVTVGHILHVSWAADHRVIDGATVARFSNLWQSYLERPTKLILELK